ncbi:MAG: DMT family transporter [Sporichthyaceae bacterium]|nr:DMT family transporter [Sporichthyaceae bacterium]
MQTRDHAVFIAVAGAASIATSATWVRLADVEPATAAAFRCLYALPILIFFAARERSRLGGPSWRERWFSVAAGLFFAIDLVLWHHAINYVGGGIATVLGNLQVVFVTLAAWVIMGERPSRRFIATLPIVLTGVVLITGMLEQGAYGVDPVRGVIFGVGTSVAYAVSLLLLRSGAGKSRRGSAALLDFTAAAALGAAALGPISGGFDPIPHWPAHGWLIALAVVAQALGWLLISYALPRLRAAMTALLLLFQPAGAMLLGAVVMAEQPSLLQIGGSGLVLAGVLLAARRERSVAEPELGPEPALERSDADQHVPNGRIRLTSTGKQARAGVVVATPNATTPTAGVVATRTDGSANSGR